MKKLIPLVFHPIMKVSSCPITGFWRLNVDRAGLWFAYTDQQFSGIEPIYGNTEQECKDGIEEIRAEWFAKYFQH